MKTGLLLTPKNADDVVAGCAFNSPLAGILKTLTGENTQSRTLVDSGAVIIKLMAAFFVLIAALVSASESLISLQFGSNWTSGTYIVQVVQGKNIKTLKLIKGEG